MSIPQLKREAYNYQAAYCEENIWHLCQQPSLKNSYVVFITSKGEAFPMLNQRASDHPLVPIYWDYHVVLLLEGETTHIVDFDTQLDFSTDLATYFKESFVDESLLLDNEKPLFRLVPSKKYIDLFSSNRSHMQTSTGWLAPPPNWPAIGNSENNLSAFIQAKNNEFGDLLAFDRVLDRFVEPH